jgi:glycosyltransferase involved in cell wall biosynthesis
MDEIQLLNSTVKNKNNIKPKFFYEKFKKSFSIKVDNFKNCGGLRLKSEYKKDLGNKPLVSIITVCQNSEKTIKNTIKSVLNQNYDNIEYIIIDGESKDETLKIIQSFDDKIDFWVSEKDTGIYNAMNKGILLSSGSIIGILNSDDVYKKNAACLASKYFANKKIDFCFGSVEKDRLLSGFNMNKIKWKFNIFPSHSGGFFISQKSQLDCGLYDEQFKLHADYDLIYRLVVKLKKIGISMLRNEITGIFGAHGLSKKESKIRYFYEEFRIRKKNNQNLIYILLLFIIKILHYYLIKNELIKNFLFKLRKKINY